MTPPATLQPDATTEASPTPDSDDDEGDDDDDSVGGAVTVVTLGTETLEFDTFTGPGCVTIGGQVSGGAAMTGTEVTMNFTIPPEDWETNERFRDPPSISVLDWDSDPTVRWDAWEDDGNVDYTIDESGTSGTATFTSQALRGSADFVSETLPGTFDIDCG